MHNLLLVKEIERGISSSLWGARLGVQAPLIESFLNGRKGSLNLQDLEFRILTPNEFRDELLICKDWESFLKTCMEAIIEKTFDLDLGKGTKLRELINSFFPKRKADFANEEAGYHVTDLCFGKGRIQDPRRLEMVAKALVPRFPDFRGWKSGIDWAADENISNFTKVGIIGASGSGKTTLIRKLPALGVSIVDGDSLMSLIATDTNRKGWYNDLRAGFQEMNPNTLMRAYSVAMICSALGLATSFTPNALGFRGREGNINYFLSVTRNYEEYLTRYLLRQILRTDKGQTGTMWNVTLSRQLQYEAAAAAINCIEIDLFSSSDHADTMALIARDIMERRQGTTTA